MVPFFFWQVPSLSSICRRLVLAMFVQGVVSGGTLGHCALCTSATVVLKHR
jgi:hypothetical protein